MPPAVGFDDTDGDSDLEFKPLTAQEAADHRALHPAVSPWRVIAWQCGAGLLLTVLLLAWVGKAEGVSAAYGALAVILPAALFARGIMGRFASLNVVTAVFGFFVWEAAKLVVSVVLVVLAPRVLVDLSWLALLAGLFVALKIYWLAFIVRPRQNELKA